MTANSKQTYHSTHLEQHKTYCYHSIYHSITTPGGTQHNIAYPGTKQRYRDGKYVAVSDQLKPQRNDILPQALPHHLTSLIIIGQEREREREDVARVRRGYYVMRHVMAWGWRGRAMLACRKMFKGLCVGISVWEGV